jgi:hypothetical protein
MHPVVEIWLKIDRSSDEEFRVAIGANSQISTVHFRAKFGGHLLLFCSSFPPLERSE